LLKEKEKEKEDKEKGITTVICNKTVIIFY
jgi:hypothetical protein